MKGIFTVSAHSFNFLSLFIYLHKPLSDLLALAMGTNHHPCLFQYYLFESSPSGLLHFLVAAAAAAAAVAPCTRVVQLIKGTSPLNPDMLFAGFQDHS